MKKLLAFILFESSFFAYGQDTLMIDGKPCGIHGSSQPGSSTYIPDALKNRYNFPDSSDFDFSLTLSDFVNGSATENKYSDSTAVEVTGYVLKVVSGGPEACNCEAKHKSFWDTHIHITLDSSKTQKKDIFVAEVTPRIRDKVAGRLLDWSTKNLKKRIEKHIVKIQGWLFYDILHKNGNFADETQDNKGEKNWRATGWEIHPITNIEVMN